MVRRIPPPAPVTVRVIGIDEWAWRRGRTYGTIIVDLEHNTIADLLPDRETASVAECLRDRAEVYGEGVRQGAPIALHVADRCHLLRNLSRALQTIVRQHQPAIRSAADHVLGQQVERSRADQATRVPLTAMQKRNLATQARHHDRYEELLRLHQAVASVGGIALILPRFDGHL
jgi:transposase